MVCENINNCKTGKSKKDGNLYKFEYVKKEDIPDNYKKSSDLRLKISDEEKMKRKKEALNKWQNKKFTCSRCNKTYKNSYKFYHNKKCK